MPRCVVCQHDTERTHPFGRDGEICGNCIRYHGMISCSMCGRYEWAEDFRWVSSSDRESPVCRNCFSDHFFFCPVCGGSRRIEDRNADGVCPECVGRIPVFSFDYKPEFQFHKCPGEHTKLFYGIELEVELEGNDVYVLGQDLPKEFYFKHDGSLSNGVEIVSHPMTMQFLRTKAYPWWNNIFSKWRNCGCRSEHTTTCGMHVHMSLDAFSRMQVFKVIEFMRRNKEFILHFTQRMEGNLDRWAYLDTVAMAKKKAITKTQYGHDRHSAINLATGTTVEIRIFRGTLNPDEFWRNLEFCECLYEFTDNYSPAHMDAVHFMGFVLKHKKRWPKLSAFFRGVSSVPSMHKETTRSTA